MRPVFNIAPPEFGVSLFTVVLLNKAFYGLSEAGVHWFKTDHRFHIDSPHTTHADHDMCFFFTPGIFDEAKAAHGLTVLQTHDTLTI